MAGSTHLYIIFEKEIPDIDEIYYEMKEKSGLNSIVLEKESASHYFFKINDFNGLVFEDCESWFDLTLKPNEWEFWGYTQHHRYLEELFLFILERKGVKLKTASGEIYKLGVDPLLGERWDSKSKKWRWLRGHPDYYKMPFWRKLLPW